MKIVNTIGQPMRVLFLRPGYAPGTPVSATVLAPGEERDFGDCTILEHGSLDQIKYGVEAPIPAGPTPAT